MDVISLLKDVGVPIITGTIMYFAGSHKNSVDIKKTEAEIEKLDLDKRFEEVELFEKIKKVLSDQNKQLEEYIAQLEQRIEELENTVERQNAERCSGDSCPTKIAYNKILVSREKRKQKRAAKLVILNQQAQV